MVVVKVVVCQKQPLCRFAVFTANVRKAVIGKVSHIGTSLPCLAAILNATYKEYVIDRDVALEYAFNFLLPAASS